MPGSMPTSPWHMWGWSWVFDLDGTASGEQYLRQLAKVSNKVPTSWGFFCAAKILQGPTTPDANKLINVNWNIYLGVGRSVFSTKSPSQNATQQFGQFRWDIPAGNDPGSTTFPKWTTEFGSPLLNDQDANSSRPINRFTAQEIQLSVAINPSFALNTPATPRWKIEVTGFVAPLVHIRPDWFSESFLGNETGGH